MNRLEGPSRSMGSSVFIERVARTTIGYVASCLTEFGLTSPKMHAVPEHMLASGRYSD